MSSWFIQMFSLELSFFLLTNSADICASVVTDWKTTWEDRGARASDIESLRMDSLGGIQEIGQPVESLDEGGRPCGDDQGPR